MDMDMAHMRRKKNYLKFTIPSKEEFALEIGSVRGSGRNRCCIGGRRR